MPPPSVSPSSSHDTLTPSASIRRATRWRILSATLLGVGGVVWLMWSLQVRGLERQITQKRSTLKTLHVGERVPPTKEVTTYFTTRATALEHEYHAALSLLTVGSMASVVEGHPDPQLYFQQRLHEVRGTLERVARARGMEIPTPLGLPKELPPPDAVPRFLVQVGLMEDAAQRLLVVPGVWQVVSFKAEEPYEVVPPEDGQERFLTALPVRVRVQCSLEALAAILGVLDRAKPLIDLQELQVVAPVASQALEVELIVAQYLVTRPDLLSEDGPPPNRAKPHASSPREDMGKMGSRKGGT